MKNNRIIPVCIVGAGFGKKVLLPLCEQHSNLQVNALVLKESHPEGIPKNIEVFTNLEDALRETATELVFVASPHLFHEKHVNISLEADKHVLCEKPLATNFIVAKILQQKCLERGLIGGVDYSFRFIPARAYFSDLVRSGVIGEPRFMYLSFFRDDFNRWPSKWYYDRNQGGGMLLATGSHLIDSARLLLGSKIASLTAVIHDYNNIDVGFVINLETENGALCTIAVSHKIPGQGKHLIEVHGTNGSMFLNQDGTVIQVKHGEAKQCFIPASYFVGFVGQQLHGDARLQPVARVIDKVVSAILKSKKLELLDFKAGVENQKIIDAVRVSNKEERRVYLNEYK